MGCAICEQAGFLRCQCKSQQPFCDQCAENNNCVEVIDAECAIYHLANDKPTKLINLNFLNGANVSEILEKIDGLINQSFSGPILVIPTPSINLTATGPHDHTLTASVNLSPDSANQLEIRDNGLYSKASSDNFKVKVNETDIPDYLKNQVIGGTDGIVSISALDQDGLLTLQPLLDLQCLIDALRDKPEFIDLICKIARYCTDICPYSNDIITEIVTV